MKARLKTFIFNIPLWLGWLLGASLAAPSFAAPGPIYGPHEGYLESVEEEKNLIIHELVLMPEPVSRAKNWRRLIFDPKLRGEFKHRYQREFGRTDVVRNVEAPNRYAELEYSNGVRVTPKEDVERKQKFGEYMVKRLTEHHVDNYFKSNPTVAPVYELKERISKANVKVKGGYEFKFNYSLSGNYLQVKVDNPQDVYNYLTFQMNPSQFGPSTVRETIFYLRYPFENDSYVATDYRVEDGILSLIGGKRLTASLRTTLTGSTFVHEHGTSQRQHRVLLGLSWTH